MILGHSAAPGGGSLEQIALAAGVVLLGLAFLAQKSLNRWVSILLVVLGLAGLVGSFTFLQNVAGEDTITVQGQEYEVSQLQDGLSALCTARNEAEDPERAQVVFLDRVHVPLHVMVAGLQDDDRALSGELLEAKQRVEEEFAEGADPERLEQGLEELIDVTVDALTALDIPASTC